jgi:glutathione S-transferase
LLRARCHFIEEWSDEVLHWYGAYEQRRMTDSDAVDQAYFSDLPEAVRPEVVELLRDNVEQCLSSQGVGRYPVDKVKGDVRRGLDSLAALVEADGFVAGTALSLADLALIGQFERRMSGTNPWMESEIRSRPALTDWLERVDALTAL